jgi:hypothetical protein
VGDDGENDKPKLNALAAAAKITAALAETSQSKPATICDLAMVIAGVCRYDWKHTLRPSVRQYYRGRVVDIITSLSRESFGGKVIAEGKRGNLVVFFFVESP